MKIKQSYKPEHQKHVHFELQTNDYIHPSNPVVYCPSDCSTCSCDGTSDRDHPSETGSSSIDKPQHRRNPAIVPAIDYSNSGRISYSDRKGRNENVVIEQGRPQRFRRYSRRDTLTQVSTHSQEVPRNQRPVGLPPPSLRVRVSGHDHTHRALAAEFTYPRTSNEHIAAHMTAAEAGKKRQDKSRPQLQESSRTYVWDSHTVPLTEYNLFNHNYATKEQTLPKSRKSVRFNQITTEYYGNNSAPKYGTISPPGEIPRTPRKHRTSTELMLNEYGDLWW